MNKEQLLKELEYLRETTHTEWAALDLLTANDDYDEEYEDTVTRLTLEGTLTGLEIATALIKGDN
jgi:hypothetical protein